MKRVALLLLAALLATPSYAGRVAVIPPNSYYGSSGNADASGRQQIGKWLELLDVMGVQYDVLPQSVCPTNQIARGLISFPAGTRTYSAFIHIGWKIGGTNAPGYNPDSLWRAGDAVSTRARWSTVPQIFCGPTSTSSVDFAGTAACTTAVNGLPSSFFGADVGISTHAFLTNGPEVWHEYSSDNVLAVPPASFGVFYGAMTRNTAITSGITRTIVGISRRTPGAWTGMAGTTIDDFARPAQTSADTFALMARYRSATEKAPIIFLYPNPGNGTNPSVSLMAMAVAVADSASGGQIIGQKPGWMPRKIAVYVSRAFTRGSYTAVGSNHESRGFFCVADTCDSAFFKASIDSIASLNIPVTIGVNVDSVSAYPYETAWWNRIAKRKYTVESWNGVSAVASNATVDTAGVVYQPDIFGKTRTRVLFPSSGRSVGSSCPDGDTSLTCLLTYARNKLARNGLTPLSRALIGPESDYVPTNFSASSLPTWDSLGVALLAAGYTHVITNADAASSAPISFSQNGSGTTQPAVTNTGVLDGFRERVIPVFSGRVNGGQTRVGTIINVCARGFVDDPQAAAGKSSPMYDLSATTHPYANEFLQGVFGNIWYANDLPYYFHSFRTPTSVYIIRAGGLGSFGTSAVSKTRYEWYYLKWLYNQVSAINKLAGRTVIRFMSVDEL